MNYRKEGNIKKRVGGTFFALMLILLNFFQLLSGMTPISAVTTLDSERTAKGEGLGVRAEIPGYFDPDSFTIFERQLPMRGSMAGIEMFWNREKKNGFKVGRVMHV